VRGASWVAREKKADSLLLVKVQSDLQRCEILEVVGEGTEGYVWMTISVREK